MVANQLTLKIKEIILDNSGQSNVIKGSLTVEEGVKSEGQSQRES